MGGQIKAVGKRPGRSVEGREGGQLRAAGASRWEKMDVDVELGMFRGAQDQSLRYLRDQQASGGLGRGEGVGRDWGKLGSS